MSSRKPWLLIILTLLSLRPLPASAFDNGPARQNSKQTATTAAEKWERYAFPGDEFSVELPAMPFVYHTRRIIAGTDKEKMRVFGVYAQNAVFMIVAYDKPRRGERLEDFAAYPWFRRRPPASVREIMLGGLKGKEYFSLNPPHAASRVFMTKKRAYLVHTFSVSERDPLTARFLDSLQLSENPQGKVIAETDASPAPTTQPEPFPPGPGRAGGHPQNTLPGRAEGQDDSDRVFPMRDVESKAIIVYRPNPPFTDAARKDNTTGVVRLRAVLTASGKVTNVSVVKSLPDGLTENAVNAARSLLFFPAVKDGRAVSQHITLEYNFNIY